MLTKLLKRLGYYPYASVELAHERGYWAGREDEQYLTQLANEEAWERSDEAAKVAKSNGFFVPPF